MEATGTDEMLQDVKPTRTPRPYRRHGTNYGVTNAAGLWLYDGKNFANFTTKLDALTWLRDPSRRHSSVLNFQPYDTEPT